MPVYCYTNTKTGETIERVYPAAQMRRRIRHQGRVYVLDMVAQHAGHKKISGHLWPKESWSVGVYPNEVEKALESDRKLGVPCRINPETGGRIFESNAHRKKWMKAWGVRDNSAYC